MFSVPGFKIRMQCRSLDQLRANLALFIMGRKNRRALRSYSDAVVAGKRTHELDCRGSIAYMLPFLKVEDDHSEARTREGNSKRMAGGAP